MSEKELRKWRSKYRLYKVLHRDKVLQVFPVEADRLCSVRLGNYRLRERDARVFGVGFCFWSGLGIF
jgi:hypothetical protein